MYKKNKSIVALIAVLMVAVLVTGCLPWGKKTQYTLEVVVKPEEAAEVKDVADKYDEGALVKFTLEFDAEVYKYVGIDVDNVLVKEEEGVLKVEVAEIKENITITFEFEEIEEEPPVDEELEEAIAAAVAAIADLPAAEEVALEDEEAIVAARALVDAVFELDEEAEIEGLDKLAEVEEALAELVEAAALAAAIEAAEEAIADLEEDITLADTPAVQDARELVDAAVELGADEDEIEGIERLVAVEAALVSLLSGENLIDEDEIKALFDEGIFEESYTKDELVLPTELTVGGVKFKLFWSSESDLVEIEDGVATFTTPDEDATVILRAVLAVKIGIGAQAEPKIYEVKLEIEGWVSKLVAAVSDNEQDDFELALIGLEIEYKDKDELDDFMKVLDDAFTGLEEEEIAALTKEDIVNFLDAHYEAEDLLKAFADAVEDYEDEKTQKALKALNAAVADLGLENWFEDLLDGYLDKDLKGAASKKDVQALIDEVNKDKLGELITAAEGDVRNNDLYVEAKAFFDAIKANLEEEDAEGYEEDLELIANIFAVLDADKDGIVAALKAYDDELLVLDVLAKEYVEAFEVDEDEGDPLEGTNIESIVGEVNDEELEAAIAAVVVEAAKEEDDKFAEALTHLTKVAVIENEDFAEEAWDISGDMDAYKKAVKDAEPAQADAEAILAIVNEVNLVAAINAADAEELVVLILDEKEIAAFINLSAEQRVEVAERLIAAKPEKGYASSEGFFTTIEATVSSYLGQINAVNNAEETTAMIGALDAIFEDYAKLPGSEKTTIADAVIDAKPKEGYTTIAAIKAAM